MRFKIGWPVESYGSMDSGGTSNFAKSLMLFSGDLITLRTRATGMERFEVMITSCIGREIDDVER